MCYSSYETNNVIPNHYYETNNIIPNHYYDTGQRNTKSSSYYQRNLHISQIDRYHHHLMGRIPHTINKYHDITKPASEIASLITMIATPILISSFNHYNVYHRHNYLISHLLGQQPRIYTIQSWDLERKAQLTVI